MQKLEKQGMKAKRALLQERLPTVGVCRSAYQDISTLCSIDRELQTGEGEIGKVKKTNGVQKRVLRKKSEIYKDRRVILTLIYKMFFDTYGNTNDCINMR